MQEKNFDFLELKFNAMKLNNMINLIYDFDVSEKSIGVSFVGVPGINNAMKNSEYLELFNSADICSIDGAPVAKLAQKAGIDCERCAGPDVMDGILKKGIESHKRHFFYGGTKETIDLLVKRLREEYPGIEICGYYSPPFRILTKEEQEEIIKNIDSTNPDYIWVGLGQPKQDLWIKENKEKIQHVKFMGVGAAFNFFAGTVKRAPKWIQKIGLEWLFRFFAEPRYLFKRYIIGGFVWKKNLRIYKKNLRKNKC